MKEIPVDQLDLIKKSAQACIDSVHASMNVALTYDEASILAVDGLIQRAWPQRPPAKNAPMRIQTWGSFVGEVMCRMLDARWVATEHGFGVAVGLMVAHPFAKLEKRFNNGMGDSISHFYTVFKERSAPGRPEREGRLPGS